MNVESDNVSNIFDGNKIHFLLGSKHSPITYTEIALQILHVFEKVGLQKKKNHTSTSTSVGEHECYTPENLFQKSK